MKNYIYICIIILLVACKSDYQSKKIIDLSRNHKFTIYANSKEGSGQFHYKIEGYSNYNFLLKFYFFANNLEKPYQTYILDYEKGKIKYKANMDFYYSNSKGKVVIEYIPSSNLTKGELTIGGKI